MTDTDLSLMWLNKLVLRQLKTDVYLMDTGWAKRKTEPMWWQQISTACCQHMWVKRALQNDLLLRMRFNHLTSRAAGCSSSWKLFLLADMWVLIGQFSAQNFKPLLNISILINHKGTTAVQTPSWFWFLNLVYYILKWDIRSFVFISTCHSSCWSSCWCFLGVHNAWFFFFLPTTSLAQMPTN